MNKIWASIIALICAICIMVGLLSISDALNRVSNACVTQADAIERAGNYLGTRLADIEEKMQNMLIGVKILE